MGRELKRCGEGVEGHVERVEEVGNSRELKGGIDFDVRGHWSD